MAKQRRPAGDEHWSRRFPDRVRRGSAASGAKLTAEHVDEACALYEQFGMSCTQIAQHFGVSRVTIWRHLKARGLID